MNISNVRVRLTEKDLLSIIEENVKVQGLKIEKINIGELIKIEGVYIKGIKIKFKAALGLGNLENNVIKLMIFNAKLGIIPIWTKLINFALSKILKNFADMGLRIEKSTVFLDFTALCKYIPSVDFILKEIITTIGGLEVQVVDLIYKESKQALSLEELKEKAKSIEDDLNEKVSPKTQDSYSKIRGRFSNNLVNCTENYEGRFSKTLQDNSEILAEIIMFVPDIMALLYRLMKDSRINLKTRALIGAALTYFVLPADIIPETIPVLGKADDLGIGFILLDKIIGNIPENIIMEHWEGKEDIFIKAKEVREALFNSIGRKNTISIMNGVLVGARKVKRRKKR